MVLNLINIIGVLMVWVLLFPHIIYATRSAEGMISCNSKIMNLIAQIGRYASMLLMVLPLGIWEFGFSSNGNMIIYFCVNILLLAAYIIAWIIYFKKGNFGLSIVLILLEGAVFLNCGICLEHFLLVCSSAIFIAGNIFVALKHQKELKNNE